LRFIEYTINYSALYVYLCSLTRTFIFVDMSTMTTLGRIHEKQVAGCELTHEERLVLELVGGGELTSDDVARLLLLFSECGCVKWMPKTLFGCIELTVAAGKLGDEQIHIMRLFRLGNTHGLLRKLDPSVHEMQYCPDCKTIVSTQKFCCALAKEYREKCDAT
jgi:hypothetical protein